MKKPIGLGRAASFGDNEAKAVNPFCLYPPSNVASLIRVKIKVRETQAWQQLNQLVDQSCQRQAALWLSINCYLIRRILMLTQRWKIIV